MVKEERSNFTIIHQQQPTEDSCVSACIAMLTGMDVNEVVQKFHSLYLNSYMTPYEYLTDRQVCLERLYSDSNINESNIYMVAVPNLDQIARMHSVLVDRRDGKFVVYDPKKGCEGKRYYIGPDDTVEDEWQVCFRDFTPDYKVILPRGCRG